MRFLLAAARKDLLRLLRDPTAILLWMGIPLLIGALITLAFGGGGGRRPQAHLLVVDEDETFLTAMLTRGLGASGGEGRPLVRVEEVGREDGLSRIHAGEASALLIMPAGTSDAFLREKPATLTLYRNPAQRILPGIVEEGLSILVDGTFYLHRVVGREIAEIVAGPAGGARVFPDADVARLSVSINEAVKRLEKYLFPPVIELETAVDEPASQREDVGYALLFLPGIIFMALLFTAQGLADDLWRERLRGTLRRVASAPRPLSAFLAGKVLAGLVLLGAIGLVSIVLGAAYLGVSFSRVPAAVGWATVSGGVFLCLMIALQLFASSQRAGQILAMGLMFPLLMIGGSFFPFEAMPGWMATIGRLTPNGWALERLKAILLGRLGAGDLVLGAGFLVAAGGAVFWVAQWRLRAAFARR